MTLFQASAGSGPQLPTYDADCHASAIRVTAREPESEHAALPCPPCEFQDVNVPQIWCDTQLKRYYQWLRRSHRR